MNVSPDQVRAATRSAAAVITADNMPPLRLEELDESPSSNEFVHRTRRGWMAPLAAAAAVVVIIVAGSVAASSWFAKPTKSQPGAPSAHGSAAPPGSFAGVPPYYVTFEHATSAVVRATATGAALATVTIATPFAGVAGAADDRTFVLDAQRQVMGPVVTWPGQPEFYLLRLTASGAERSFTRLTLPALPKGTTVTGLALSPDGRQLAVEANTVALERLGLQQIGIYTLATGAYRTWSTTGSEDSEDSDGFTGSGVDGSATLSWAADSTTLAFDWENRSHVVGVRLLNTSASGDDLIADSRLAVVESSGTGPPSQGWRSGNRVSQCVTDAIMSLDGSAVVCGYDTTVESESSYGTTTGFVRYSTATGRSHVISVFQFHGQSGGDISLLWVDPAGQTLIGGIGTPRGVRFGVIRGDSFTPLPGVGYLGAAAW